jgi:hypothetical protein
MGRTSPALPMPPCQIQPGIDAPQCLLRATPELANRCCTQGPKRQCVTGRVHATTAYVQTAQCAATWGVRQHEAQSKCCACQAASTPLHACRTRNAVGHGSTYNRDTQRWPLAMLAARQPSMPCTSCNNNLHRCRMLPDACPLSAMPATTGPP